MVERCLELLRGLDAPARPGRRHGLGRDRAGDRGRAAGRAGDRIDVSEDALALARENAAAAGLGVRFEQADVREGLAGRYDLVVSNPPYVSADEIETLEPEVRDWEPRLATVGEEHTEAVARAARDVLEPGGWLVLEIADGAPRGDARYPRGTRVRRVRAGHDLAGRERVVEGRWPTSTKQ